MTTTGSMTVAVLVLVAGMASGQSLGEVAEKEKARRAKNQESGVKAKTVTEDELKTAGKSGAGNLNVLSAPGSTPSTAPAATPASSPAPAKSGAGPTTSGAVPVPVVTIPVTEAPPPAPAPAPSQASESGGANETSWRNRAAQARQRAATADTRLMEAQKAMNAFLYGPDLTGCRTAGECDLISRTYAQRKQQAQVALDAAKAEVAAAKSAWDRLEDEARRAGALPGWLR